MEIAAESHEPSRPQNLRKVLARAARGTFVVGVAALGLQFVVHVFFARFLGEVQYGIFMYVMSWLTLLLLLAKLGFDTTLVVYGAGYKARTEWPALRGLLRRTALIALTAATLTSIATAAIAYVLLSRRRPQLADTFYVGAVILPAFALLGLRQSALRGLGRVVLAQALEPLMRLLILLALAGGLWLVGRSIAAPLAMALNGLAIAASLLAAHVALGRATPAPARTAAAEYRSDVWWAMALPSMLSAGMNVILKQSDIILIGVLTGDVTAAGIYAVATRVSMLSSFGLTAVNAALAPMISSLHHTGQHDKMKRLVRTATLGIFAITLPLSAGLLLLGKYVLSIFGASFQQGFSAMVVLVIAQLINASCGSVGQIMTMTEQQRPKAWILGTGAALNILLNVLLIPAHGMLGAAIATGVATVFWNIAMSIYVIRSLDLNPTVFSLFRS